MQITIKQLSSTGFQSTANKWYRCDNFKILNNDIFQKLKEGTVVDNLKCNDKGFITSFTIVEGEGQMEIPRTHSVQTPSAPIIKASDKDRAILKGQALNIAFKDIDVNLSNARMKAIENAKKIFNELETANYYQW